MPPDMVGKLHPARGGWLHEEPGRLELIEPAMSYEQQYNLVKIAHETTDREVKDAALKILLRALNPVVMVVPHGDKDGPD